MGYVAVLTSDPANRIVRTSCRGTVVRDAIVEPTIHVLRLQPAGGESSEPSPKNVVFRIRSVDHNLLPGGPKPL